jgi:Putative Actinobacterial Holin-X, holin superfamily III
LAAENGNENLAQAVTDVSERVSVLVREEIELVKAEVRQRLVNLRLGIVGFAFAAALALLAIPFALLAIAWGLNSALNSLWLGFVIVLGVLILLLLISALFGYRKIKKGNPTPTMAIDEAKKIRATVSTRADV